VTAVLTPSTAVAGNDTITGDAGADVIWAADGDDSVTGGAGDDMLYTNGDTTTKGGGADTIDAGEGSDYLQASPRATNSTSSLAAVLLGGIGNDFIDVIGTTGNLSIDAGNDNDVVLVRNDTSATQPFTADFTKLEGGTGGSDVLHILSDVGSQEITRTVNASSGFESIVVSDVFDLSDSTTANISAFIDGTARDLDTTNNLTNALAADTDADELNIASATTLALGGTTKAIMVNLTNEVVNITVTTGSGADTINMGSGNDSINGGAGADSILAGAGADTIVGAQDDDLLNGEVGADVLQVGATFEDISDAQIVNIETVTVATTNGIRLSLDGQTEAFTITGNAGNETIVGGAGADTITGGVGSDNLTGGAGADVYNYTAANESLASAFDTIVGFNAAQDVINFDALIAGGPAAPGVITALAAVLNGTAAEFAGNRIVVSSIAATATTFVYLDVDGSNNLNAGDMQVVLTGTALGIVAGNFVI
jgi:Ca2+-binding RTX toxin-like protein